MLVLLDQLLSSPLEICNADSLVHSFSPSVSPQSVSQETGTMC